MTIVRTSLVLTAEEIRAVLQAAFNCDIQAMARDCDTKEEGARLIAAYERGTDKLSATALRMEGARARRRASATP